MAAARGAAALTEAAPTALAPTAAVAIAVESGLRRLRPRAVTTAAVGVRPAAVGTAIDLRIKSWLP